MYFPILICLKFDLGLFCVSLTALDFQALDDLSAVWSYFDISARVLFAKPSYVLHLSGVFFALCSSTLVDECWYVSHVVKWGLSSKIKFVKWVQ